MRHLLAWDRIKDLILFIPAIHLLVCFGYLFFYEMSFGHGVHNFSSPTDVFSVSISRIAPTYITLAIMMPIAHILYQRQELKRVARRKRGQHNISWLYITSILAGLALILLSSVGVLILAIIGRIYTGFWPFALLYFPLGLIMIAAMSLALRKFGLGKTWVTPAVGTATLIAFVTSTAMSQGQKDRSRTYGSLAVDLARCKDFVILMPLSKNYLAAHKDNSRAVISEKCEKLFEVYSSREFRPVPNGLLYRMDQ